MSTHISRRSCLIAALISLFVASAAWPLVDVIDRPSISSRRATKALLLTVTRADQRLVAAGERGTVLLSDDNGISWRQAQVPVSVTLTSVRFVDEQNGWATGHSGVLLNTTDGGETWRKRLDGNEVAKIVLDAELAKGAAADPAQLAEAELFVADGPDKPLLDVCFLSEELGYVVGAYGLFLRTDDGGRTWSPWQARLPDLQGRHLTRIAQLNGALYLVGEQGVAYLSTDGGATFKDLKSPYGGTFFGVDALSSNEVLIYGLRGHAFRVGPHELRGHAFRDGRRGLRGKDFSDGLRGKGFRGRLRREEWTRLDSPTPVSFTASVRLASGKTIIASQTGDLLQSAEDDSSLTPVREPIHTLITAMAEAADGSLIVAGRGISRLFLKDGNDK